jgi:hypothetical protein
MSARTLCISCVNTPLVLQPRTDIRAQLIRFTRINVNTVSILAFLLPPLSTNSSGACRPYGSMDTGQLPRTFSAMLQPPVESLGDSLHPPSTTRAELRESLSFPHRTLCGLCRHSRRPCPPSEQREHNASTISPRKENTIHTLFATTRPYSSLYRTRVNRAFVNRSSHVLACQRLSIPYRFSWFQTHDH